MNAIITKTMGNRYTHTAITLHWAMALLIFITFPLGVYMHDLPLSPDKLRLYSYHKWIGVTLFLLVLLRILWRATHRPPPLLDSMRHWEKIAAHSAHSAHHRFFIAMIWKLGLG